MNFNFLLQRLLKFSLIGFFLLFFPRVVLANNDFETSYFFTYTVFNNANTLVNQEIIIKNLTEKIYVNEYSLTIGSNLLTNIKASDSYGTLQPEIKIGENFTTITIKFKEKVVGKEKENHIIISYETSDFSIIKGQILEVNIPALAQKEELFDYGVKLLVPSSFGPPSFIQPTPVSKSTKGDYQVFDFNKERLLKIEGVNAAFGEAQIFDFKFLYYLENKNTFPIKTEISLPADTSYQKIYYLTLDPPPLDIKVDEDDNWMAAYQLSGLEKLTVTATGSSQLFIRSQQELKGKPLTENNLTKYLNSQKYWEVDNPEIQELANQLKTPEKIYKYVASNLIYDYGRLGSQIERFGASKTLQNKQSALCTEFADLFITLCRAAGIPAREIDGYAFTLNPKLRPVALDKDILHAWAEYYDSDKQLWIPVDPTWEMTTGGVDYFNKLDLNHFAFVRHGIESDYPAPAGAYSPNPETKTIFIEFGQKKNFAPKITINGKLSKKIIAGFPIKGEVSLINEGPGAIHKSQLIIEDQNSYQFEEIIDVLPPFSKKIIPISINSIWWQEKVFLIKVKYLENINEFEVISYPLPKYIFIQLSQFLSKIATLTIK